MSKERVADYRDFKYALQRLLSDPKLRQQLKAQETAPQAREALEISEDVGTDLLTLLTDIELYQLSTQTNTRRPASATEKAEKAESGTEINSAKSFFEEAFTQLKRTYKTSILMSVTMFVLGVGFLLLAAYQAIFRPDNITTTSVVGGIGIIQIVALFYRNPLADIARSVSNAQQAKLAITSYLIGITLIHHSIGNGTPNDNHIKNLLQVTDKALGQLQKYAEDHHVSETVRFEKQKET